MTSLDLPSDYLPPADSPEEDTVIQSGDDDDYEQSAQSAAFALLGMAALPLFPLSEYASGSAKRELVAGRQLADSRGNSSDDLSSTSSNGGNVKRRRSETKDHGGGPPPG